jgi:glycosyltransferase involved in cell wall biosynthesis
LRQPDRPLRIALLGYRSAPFSGGQGVYLRYLSQALQALGHHVTVVSGPPYPHLVEGVELVKLPSLDLYSRDLWSVGPQELRNRLGRKEWLSKLSGGFAEPWAFGERARDWLLENANHFDVIHDNQTLAPGILDLQKAGLPVVTTIHHPITRDLRVGAVRGADLVAAAADSSLAFFFRNAKARGIAVESYRDRICRFGNRYRHRFWRAAQRHQHCAQWGRYSTVSTIACSSAESESDYCDGICRRATEGPICIASCFLFIVRNVAGPPPGADCQTKARRCD